MNVNRDPERLDKLRIAVRYLLRGNALARGHQSRLAEHFDISRQRVHQVVQEERLRKLQVAVRYLLREDGLAGREQGLARQFRVSRQLLEDVIRDEQLRLQGAVAS